MEVCMVLRNIKAEKIIVLLILVGVDRMVVDTIEAKLKILAEMVLPLLVEYNS
jgi:hypothetical protein